MANRYDIVHIDFQASARGVNAAIESIRESAKDSSTEIDKLREKIDKAMKSGQSQDIIDDLNLQLAAEQKKLREFQQAQTELVKGMRVLDQAVQHFNDGSLGAMNAAFQKSANAAAKLAQSKMDAGTKEWRQMGAIMQETEQNYSRMQRDTEQLIDYLQHGGTVFTNVLEQEKRGIKELMSIVPYMGQEYQKLSQQYEFISTKLDDIGKAERRAKGEIVDVNDALRVADQLTEKGATDAERRRQSAEKEAEGRQKYIATLEQEHQQLQENARASAEAVAKHDEDINGIHDYIDALKLEMENDDKTIQRKKTAAETARNTAKDFRNTAAEQKKSLDEVDGAVEQLDTDIKDLKQQIKDFGKEKAEPVIKPKVDTSEIDALAAKFKSTFKMTDEAFEKVFAGRPAEDREIPMAIGDLQGRLQDKFFFDRRGETNKSHTDAVALAKENIRRAIYDEISSGRWDLERLELEARTNRGYLDSIRSMKKTDGTNLTHDAEYQAQKFYNDELQRQLEIARQLGPEMQKFAQAKQQEVQESEALKASAEELKRQAAEQETQLEGVDKEVNKLTQDIQNLDKQLDKLDDEPIKPKVDTSEVERLKAELQAIATEKDSISDTRAVLEERMETLIGKHSRKGNSISWKNYDSGIFSEDQLRVYIDQLNAAYKKIGPQKEMESFSEYYERLGKAAFPDLKDNVTQFRDWEHLIRSICSQVTDLSGQLKAMPNLSGAGMNKRFDGFELKEGYLTARKEANRLRSEDNNLLQRSIDLGQQEVSINAKIEEAKKKSTQATSASVEQLEQEIEHLQRLIQENKQNIEGYQKGYDKNIQLLKEMGIAEDDITNEAKIQEAVEKKTLEIMEAEVNATKEAAEQRRKLTSEITSSQLGGSKADQTFYAQHKNDYALDQYRDTDEMMDRIAHLEMVSKLKNGKRFSDDTYWDPEDELDEDELYVMTDEEKEAALNELRVLKQHIREELLKTLHLEGDIDNALSEMTGGDGFSEDSKFGQQLNDKIQTIKNKIEEKIETTLDKYSDIIDGQYSSAYGDDGKLSKEGVREEVEEYIKDTIYDAKSYKSSIGEAQSLIEEDQKSIDTKKLLIEQTKAQSQAEEQANNVEQKRQDLLRQKEDLQTKLGEQQQEQTRLLGEINQKNTEANNLIQQAAQAEQQKTQATEESNKADNESVAMGKTKAQLEEELKQKQGERNDKMKERNKLQKDYNSSISSADAQDRKALKLETEATNLAGQHNEELEKQTGLLKEKQDAAKADIELNKKNQQLLQDNEAEQTKQGQLLRDAQARQAQYAELSVKAITDSITKFREQNELIGESDPRWAENERRIGALNQRLEEMKQKSAELRREPVLEMMTQRMDNISNLSKDAFTETKRFWQAMADGADKSDPKLKAIEGNLKMIAEEERRRNEEVLRASASRLGGNLGSLSSGDLRQAIEDAKQLRGTYAETSKEAQDLANMIVKAEEYAKTHGVEAVRQAHREKEAVRQREEQEQQLAVQMRQRLMERKTLSADALAETRKYWEAQKNGAEEGTIAFRRAEAALKMLDNVERERNAARNEQLAKRLERPEDYKNYTTAELKESVNAAKQLALAYKSGSNEAIELTKNIVAAEEHIEKYSVESTRAAKKQADAIEEMTNQLSKGTDLTETALKAQENYWRRLADDPKATNEEMERYIDNMKKAQSLQDDLVAKRGAETLGKAKAGFYDTANMTDLSTAINEIKAYQALIKDPNGAGSETFLAAKKQVDALSAQFNKLKVASESTKTTFASVDEVLQRFHQHLGDGKVEQATQQTEKLAQTLDDKLNAATWKFDDQIKSAAESVDHYEHEIKEAEQELANMEAELEKLEEKHKNSSWFRKQGKDYRLEGRRIDELRRLIEGEEIQMDDGTSFNNGQKAWIQELKKTRDRHQDDLDSWKQRKAEALGLNEAEEQLVSTEEKLLDVRRMTYDELQDGVKMLEQEAMNTDRSTEGGKKRFEELRSTINKMNEEIKVAKGEIMSLDSAMSLSMKSGTSAFEGTAEDLQKAQQAIERAIATTDKGTVKYDRLQKALVRVKAEMSGAGIASQRMKEILSDPKAEKSVDALKNAVARSRAEMDVMGQRIERMQRLLAEADKNGNNKWAERLRNSIKETTKALDEQAASTKNADQALKELGNTSKGTASSFEKAWSRLKTYVTLYMGAAVAIQKLTKTMGDLMDLSDKMGEVRKTTGFTAEEVGKLSENLKKMDVRTPLVQLMEVSAAAGQLGLKTLEDVQGFTEAANKLMIALPEMGKEAATEMMRVAIATGEVDKIRRQMQDGTIEGSSATAVAMEKIASTIDRLRATSASTAPEITDFVKRVGAVGAQSGITIDQVAALGSTISSLGMRVEMSATAISRMIPAIKNNAFDVARAIGMVPNDLRAMFDEAGGGMNAVLAILQHIKDAGMDADSIEKMLGMGGMQEVMKELNQQGARAGIVFAGLSQNVDELRRQLTVATGAYEDNIAVQQEFDKMNETTAAKWERLKNQVEEAFVSDYMQSLLGSIIDGLRKIVDLITGDVSGAWKLLTSLIWSAAAAMAAFKFGLGEGLAMLKNLILVIATPSGWKRIIASMQNAIGVTRMYIAANWQLAFSHDAAAKAAARATLANNALAKSMKANAIMAVVAALGMLIWKLVELNSASDELDETFAKLQADEAAAERDVNRLKDTFSKTSSTLENTTKKHEELKKKTEDLRKEVDEMKKSTDLSADAQKNLEEKTDELKKSEDELKKATDEMNKAKKDHSGVISDINSKYSSYLGYMLSEVTNADLVASAHQRIVAALRAELEKKRQLANQEAVEKKYDNDIAEWTKNSREELSTLPRDVQDRIMRRRSNLMAQVSYDIEEEIDKEGKKITKERWIVPAIDGIGNQRHVFTSEEGARNYLKKLTSVIVKQETVDRGVRLGKKYKIVEEKDENSPIGGTKRVMKYTGRDMTPEEFVNKIWGGAYGSLSPDDGFQRLTTAELLRMQEMERQRYQDQGAVEGAQAQENQKTLKDIMTNAGEITKTIKETKELSDKQVGEMGRQLNAVLQSSLKYGGSEIYLQQFFGNGNEVTLENAAGTLLKGLDEKTQKKVIEAAKNAERAAAGGTTTPTYTDNDNPFGDKLPAESTDYKDMAADALVNRRKQMKDFVNAIQTDSDIKSVLAEDKALKKAIEAGMSSDMRTVIEWYNTERLKIQDELNARHLTNTGDWKDPKQEKARKKRLQDDMKAYLEELDAYYTERKAKIQEARNDEEISEAEAWNRDIKNEAEWHRRRAELQKLYADKAAEVTKEEQDAIYDIIAERTEDSVDFIRKTVAQTVTFSKQIRDANAQGAREYRRFQGDLQLGWEKDFLKQRQALGRHLKAIEEIVNKERPFNGIAESLRENLGKMDILTADLGDDVDSAADELKRVTFLLGEAENAYTMTVEQLLEDMRRNGFKEWADAVNKDTSMQQGLLAMLRQTFDSVQDAIKKESSIIKKQVDIMFEDIAEQVQQEDTELKILENSVRRANSLIGAGAASERVADKLAIKQIQMQITMQETRLRMLKKRGDDAVKLLSQEADLQEKNGEVEKARQTRMDAENVAKSVGLTLTKDQVELDKQRVALAEKLEESQNRLYTQLREWGDLLTSSMKDLFEASSAGNAEYYDELAKLNLTGKGGPGAGTYVVIDNAGTEDATAHYEYLDERAALERQREIEQENARAEAWKKVLDDISNKMNDTITDQLNAMLQNQSIDANTDAIHNNTDAEKKNTEAIISLTNAIAEGNGKSDAGIDVSRGVKQFDNAAEKKTSSVEFELPTGEFEPDNGFGREKKDYQDHVSGDSYAAPEPDYSFESTGDFSADRSAYYERVSEAASVAAEKEIEASDAVRNTVVSNIKKEKDANDDIRKSTQSTFAKMTQAANLYGIAYQTMSNDNLDATQKFEMFAIQAAGNAAITMLTTDLAKGQAKNTVQMPGILGELLGQMPYPAAMATFAIVTALMGGLMGLAVSQVAKSKSQIAQATGAGASAGRLTTGMLTYAEGNVNEFTDPSSLTPGRQYNVDASDGKTYRARYMGSNPRTHITNGPEFHLSGEKGREMIIDAGTTRQITMNDTEIWHAIQTISEGNRSRHMGTRRRGVHAFAQGNINDFDDAYGSYDADVSYGGMTAEQMAAFQASLDRNNELLERALRDGIKGVFNVFGNDGLVATYDRGKKTVTRHGEKY